MGKIVKVILFIFLSLILFELSWAKKEKTGRIEKDTLIDEKFSYQLKVLSNWKIELEKEPSLVRSTLIKKNYLVDKSSTLGEEERLIPTIIIFADTTSLTLQELENSLIKGKGVFRNKEKYLMKLDVLATYELTRTKDIALDSIPAKVYGFKKSYLRPVIDLSERYGPEGSGMVTKEDFLLGAVVILKKGSNLYIIQLSGEREYFSISEEEFSKMLETWKFLK